MKINVSLHVLQRNIYMEVTVSLHALLIVIQMGQNVNNETQSEPNVRELLLVKNAKNLIIEQIPRVKKAEIPSTMQMKNLGPTTNEWLALQVVSHAPVHFNQIECHVSVVIIFNLMVIRVTKFDQQVGLGTTLP